MSNENLDASRLYALIGEPANQLPDAAFATLELLLAKHELSTDKRPVAAVDDIGTICPATASHRDPTIGLQEREALGTILEILHTAQQEREQEVDEPLLDERLLEGLIVAGRLIVGPT